jgi:Tol biopolymer transport system component
MTRNGHNTYLPGNKWVLNDTYPDQERKQHVYLYYIAEEKRIPIGDFYLPEKYSGEWRIDTHPRYSPDGKTVVIDAQNGVEGRQIYLMDISGMVE